MSLISSRSFHFALAGAFAVLAAAASTAPAEASSSKGSRPNPVLKCLGADCNDVAWRRGKRKGPNVLVCGEEIYTENGHVIVPLDPQYCPR